jgi:vacuolar protein sorting-associated protein IST1
VLRKLRVEPPEEELVTRYLEEIARTYGVAWPKREQTVGAREDGGEDDDDQPGSGGQAVKSLEEPLTTAELSRATPPRDLGPKSPVSVAPPSPSTDNLSPRVKLPQPPDLKPGARMEGVKKPAVEGAAREGGKGVVGGKIPDVDDLQRRFAALKR